MKKKKRKNFRMANGAGSVFKLSGNRRKPWAAVMSIGYTDDGVLKRKYIGYYESEEEARHALEMYKETPFNLDDKNITIAKLYEIFIERKKDKNYSTLAGYKSAYKSLLPISQVSVRNLKTPAIQNVFDSMEIKPQSKALAKSLLNQLFDIALEMDIVNKNYVKFVNIGTKTESAMHRPFTELEIRKLWQISKTDPFAELPLILCYTGMRPSELLNIKKENVCIKECWMQGGSKTEAGKNRIIPIHSAILPIIEKHLANTGVYLIQNRKGTKYTYENFRNYWNKFMKENGLQHLPHDGRHTFITFAQNKNMDRIILKRIVGHADNNVTDKIYTHKEITQLINAVNLL